MNIEEKNFNFYITPKDGKYTHVIIFLHGLGDIAKSYVDFFFEGKSFTTRHTNKNSITSISL